MTISEKRLRAIVDGAPFFPGEVIAMASVLLERSEPTYPTTLPCPVILEPGFRFGKGVSTHLVLRALQNRAERYAELDAMGPEARAEHDAAIAELREKLGFGMPAKTSIQVSLPALPQLGSDAEWYQGFAAGAGSMREGCIAALVTAGVEVIGEVK
ncbi:hypothetical protein EGY08_28460 [Klebsiella sp. FDAARGOS_511]|nr:hypothetical protein EGY08_28460 [Klebsiella sp. FDAARGOS_511]